jgi:hypothetical protein
MQVIIKLSAELTDGTTWSAEQKDEFPSEQAAREALCGMLAMILKMGGLMDFTADSAQVIPLCCVKSKIIGTLQMQAIDLSGNVDAAKAVNNVRSMTDAMLRGGPRTR